MIAIPLDQISDIEVSKADVKIPMRLLYKGLDMNNENKNVETTDSIRKNHSLKFLIDHHKKQFKKQLRSVELVEVRAAL